MPRSDYQNVTLWKRELLAAGWKPYKGVMTAREISDSIAMYSVVSRRI